METISYSLENFAKLVHFWFSAEQRSDRQDRKFVPKSKKLKQLSFNEPTCVCTSCLCRRSNSNTLSLRCRLAGWHEGQVEGSHWSSLQRLTKLHLLIVFDSVSYNIITMCLCSINVSLCNHHHYTNCSQDNYSQTWIPLCNYTMHHIYH